MGAATYNPRNQFCEHAMTPFNCPRCNAPCAEGSPSCGYCGCPLRVASSAVFAPPPESPHASANASPTPPPTPIPPDWIEVVDSWAGFAVAHPPGWETASQRGVVTIRRDRSPTAQAVFWPILLRQAQSAQQVAAQFLGWARAEFPTFEAWAAPGGSQQHILLRTRATVGTQPVEGCASVSVTGNSAMIRAYHVPAARAGLSKEATQLIAVLGTFRTAAAVPRYRFQEPGEQAFEAIVPVGWFAQGEVKRSPWTGGISCPFSARRDANGLVEAAAPALQWQFADGVIVGACLLGAMGLKGYMPAVDFASKVLPKKLKEKQSMRIEAVRDCPDMLPRLYEEIALIGLTPATAQVTAACLTSSHDFHGARVRRMTFVTTFRPRKAAVWTSMLSGQWVAQVVSRYQAPEKEFAALEPVLSGVVNSYRLSPQWIQREQQKAAQMAAMMRQQTAMIQQQTAIQQQQFAARNHAIQDAAQQTNDMIIHSYEHRQHVQDHLSHQWSNVILGRTDVVDPGSGTVYNVTSGADQYFRDNFNTIIGTNASATPQFNWHKLEPIDI